MSSWRTVDERLAESRLRYLHRRATRVTLRREPEGYVCTVNHWAVRATTARRAIAIAYESVTGRPRVGGAA